MGDRAVEAASAVPQGLLSLSGEQCFFLLKHGQARRARAKTGLSQEGGNGLLLEPDLHPPPKSKPNQKAFPKPFLPEGKTPPCSCKSIIMWRQELLSLPRAGCTCQHTLAVVPVSNCCKATPAPGPNYLDSLLVSPCHLSGPLLPQLMKRILVSLPGSGCEESMNSFMISMQRYRILAVAE